MYSTPRATSYASLHGGANNNNNRQLPKSPAAATSNTTPAIYSFSRQAQHHDNDNRNQAPLLPDSPPGPTAAAAFFSSNNNNNNLLIASSLGPYSMPQLMSASPPRSNIGVTTSNASPTNLHSNHNDYYNTNQNTNNNTYTSYISRSAHTSANASPAATTRRVMSPVVSHHAPPPPQSQPQPQPQPSSSYNLPIPQPQPQPQHYSTTTALSSSSIATAAALDSVVVESMQNKKRAEAILEDYQRLEATHREASRNWEEKSRSAQHTITALEHEVASLRRANMEQAELIAKFRDQNTALSKTKTTGDKFKTENISLKAQLKELEIKLQETETTRATLQRRLEEKERTANARSQDVTTMRSKLSNKEELVGSLSETVRARDAQLAKLSCEYQALAEELGHDKTEKMQEVARLENVIVECKERELALRRQVHDLEMQSETLRRSRDEYHQDAETWKLRCVEQGKKAKEMLFQLEEKSRGFYEVFFAYTTADHCTRFDDLFYSLKKEKAATNNKFAHLLDDTESLVKELDMAQSIAKTEINEKQLLGSEVRGVCDMSTEMMRSIEVMTSSASWRRAVIETLIPEEISTVMSKVRKDCAEIVHRTNVIAKRAHK